jgi:hypothetical protein
MNLGWWLAGENVQGAGQEKYDEASGSLKAHNSLSVFLQTRERLSPFISPSMIMKDMDEQCTSMQSWQDQIPFSTMRPPVLSSMQG